MGGGTPAELAAIQGAVLSSRQPAGTFTPSPTAIVKITETHADGTEKVTERVMNRAARRQLMAKVKRARRKACKRK